MRPPGPRSSTPRGSWRATEGLAGVSLRDLAGRSGCSRRRSTRTSTRSTRSTTRCSPRVTAQLPRARWPRRRGPTEIRAPTCKAGMRVFVEFCTEDPVALPAAVPAHDPRLRAVAGVVRDRRRGRRAGAGPLRGRWASPIPPHFDLLTAIGHRARRPADLERPRRRPLDPAHRRRHGDVLRTHCHEAPAEEEEPK